MSNPAVTNNPITIQPNTGNPQTVVYVQQGDCPNCHGFISKEFTCCGVCLGICCFPVGVVCCFAMQENKCQSCGYTT